LATSSLDIKPLYPPKDPGHYKEVPPRENTFLATSSLISNLLFSKRPCYYKEASSRKDTFVATASLDIKPLYPPKDPGHYRRSH